MISKKDTIISQNATFVTIFSSAKKGISPVVATALLLVVAVVSVVGFASWFETFKSELFVDIEQQGSISNLNIGIEALVGDTLYFRSGDETQINLVTIDGVECSGLNGTYSSGMQSLNVSNCLESVTSSRPEIVVVTNRGILSKYVFLSGNSGGSGSSSLDCSALGLAGGEWVTVPGNAALGTSDFCVMKFEAKSDGTTNCGGGACPISQAASTPWVSITQTNAITACQNLGVGYDLINNAEWMTIARNVETVSVNWADGTIGSTVASGGGLKRGNVGITDSASYNGANPEFGTGRNTLALLNLTNGEGIWDFSGNVWEWNKDTIDCSGGYPCANMPYDSSPASEWIELTAIDTYGSLSYDLTRPTNSTWNSGYGMGQIFTDGNTASDGGTTHAFLRGGHWSDGANAGAFALGLASAPSGFYTGNGFRCSYEP